MRSIPLPEGKNNDMLTSLTVGLGEIKISRDPGEVLVAYGLGSCVGVGLYDPVTRVTGMLHAILPSCPGSSDGQPSKYVDSGIALLLDEMRRAGSDRKRLVVRMAGGANMLTAPGFTRFLDIGSRNVGMAVSTLAALNLKIVGQEVGGNIGRTVRLYVADGRMTIRTAGNMEREV